MKSTLHKSMASLLIATSLTMTMTMIVMVTFVGLFLAVGH